jgi:hypothetical protein
MSENYEVRQGAALTIGPPGNPIVLRDAGGNPVTGYDGTEALPTVVWPGGTRAVTFSPSAVWVTPADATVTIPITAAETAALAIGRYDLLLRVKPTGQDPLDAYGCTLDVLAAPGSTPAPSSYCDYSWLLKFGRSWLRQLQTDDDEAGFAEQLGRARSWIEGCGHNHYRVASMTMVIGSQAFGPRRSGARSTWLQDQFDANYLMVTDEIRECCAKKALAFICEGQVGVGESAGQYARLAGAYHSQADYLATCITLSLDTNSDGFPDVNIDLSCTDPLFG